MAQPFQSSFLHVCFTLKVLHMQPRQTKPSLRSPRQPRQLHFGCFHTLDAGPLQREFLNCTLHHQPRCSPRLGLSTDQSHCISTTAKFLDSSSSTSSSEHCTGTILPTAAIRVHHCRALHQETWLLKEHKAGLCRRAEFVTTAFQLTLNSYCFKMSELRSLAGCHYQPKLANSPKQL